MVKYIYYTNNAIFPDLLLLFQHRLFFNLLFEGSYTNAEQLVPGFGPFHGFIYFYPRAEDI